MRVFLKALLKSLFGDVATSASVALAVLVVIALLASRAAHTAGWVMAAELLLAMAWLAGRYGRPRD